MAEVLKDIGSNCAKLRALLHESKRDFERIRALQISLSDSLAELWPYSEPLVHDDQLWKETLSLVASGKVLSVAAQADEALKQSSDIEKTTWVGNGSKYVQWIGKGVVQISKFDADSMVETTHRASELFGKAFSLGHAGDVYCILG